MIFKKTGINIFKIKFSYKLGHLIIALITIFVTVAFPGALFSSDSNVRNVCLKNNSEDYNFQSGEFDNTDICNLAPGPMNLLDENGNFYQGYNRISRKDPFVAGFLSWLMMGVGQIYCKDYTKGSIFMAVDLLDKLALVGVVSYVNKKYSPSGDEVVYINWKSFDSDTKLLILSYVLLKYGVRFYNVYDAIQAAKRYNSTYFNPVNKSHTSFGLSQRGIRVSYSLTF